VISAGERPSPRDYVDQTFLPLTADLFEALAKACRLRENGDRPGTSGVRATDNLPDP
jgi:hypothetical protein